MLLCRVGSRVLRNMEGWKKERCEVNVRKSASVLHRIQSLAHSFNIIQTISFRVCKPQNIISE